jgi:hypothetical protein
VKDSKGCQRDTVIDLSASNGPQISGITPVTAYCGQSNGSATVNATNGTTPYTYKWTWDTTKATLKTGSLDTDSVLKLEYVGGSAPANISVSVQCIDKNGCIANYSELLSTCIECTNKSISVTSPANICKDANITTIDGEEYFKVEMTAAVLCNNDPAYISKLSKTALDIV